MQLRIEPREKLDFSKAFAKTTSEFANSLSLDGYKYLSNKKLTLLERVIWFVVQILAAWAVVFVLLNSWNAFLENPIMTSLENPNLPISEVPYPGVSICSINKISKRKVKDFARRLSAASNISLDRLKSYMPLYGHLYSYQYYAERRKDYTDFQAILDHFYHAPTPTNVIKELILNCSDLLSDCSWAGKKQNCLQLFSLKTTMEGHCCVFNYVPLDEEETDYKPLVSEVSGYDMGLTATIELNSSDIFYSTILTEGAKIHIFYSNDFPDTTTGGLIEQIVPLGSESFVRMTATTIITTEEVRRYPIKKRKCLFKNEVVTTFGKYSYSDCILECKLKSILALCQCVPFQFSRAFEISKNYPECNLMDLICLEKYKEKWSHMYPFDYDGDEINMERQDSLICENCVSSCFGTIYTITTDFAYLYNPRNKDELLNSSIIHVFFEKSMAFQYKQDVVLYWFEIISNFGGSCSLIVGISLISIFEFVYFFTIKLHKNRTASVHK